MTQPNEYRAYFSLIGDFDPHEISMRLGLQPSRAWKKGDVNPQTNLERTFSRWCLDSRLNEFAPLEEQVADVLKQLRSYSAAVVDIRSAIDGHMQLVGYFHRDYPGFGLDEATLMKLASLRLGIDCDFYFLYSNEREDS